MKCTYYLLVSILLFTACKQNSDSSNDKKTKDAGKKEALYPYPQYIASQLAYLDTVPLGIEMVVYENGAKTDSGFISRDAFKKLALEFMVPDPNQNSLRDQYEENSFQDLTLNTITFSITAKNAAMPLQQADILLNPDTRLVKYILIKKQEKKDESIQTSRLMWVHNMNFQINSSVINKEGKETTKLVKVVWDKPFK